MDKENLLKNGFDMLYLAGCALHSVVPDKKRIEKMDLKEVYLLASRHYLHAITYLAVEAFISKNPEFKEKISNELLYEWKFMKSKAIRSNILYEEERKKLSAFFEENRIWYVFLKGIITQGLYKNSVMRQMSDNDLLFDPSRRQDVYDYFVGSGYEVILYYKGCHDSYKKKPSLHFEMHHTLYGESNEEKLFYNYYKDVKTRLIKAEGKDFCYNFSDEDFYIYTVTHNYKHYAKAGVGIRSLMDVFVYMNSKSATLDLEYIKNELAKIGIEEFECELRKLAFKIFSKETVVSYAFDSELDFEEKELLLSFLFSGTYGNKINYIKNKVKKGTENKKFAKFRYIFSRLFPSMGFFKTYYPKIYKYKILIPFAVIYRIFFRSFLNFEELMFELKVLFKKK